jgi:replicative superfamily II helicase
VEGCDGQRFLIRVVSPVFEKSEALKHRCLKSPKPLLSDGCFDLGENIVALPTGHGKTFVAEFVLKLYFKS